MPNFDGTGPIGIGPMTGRGRGKCKQVFASKLNQIQHETGEPHTDRCKVPNHSEKDVFVRRNQR